MGTWSSSWRNRLAGTAHCALAASALVLSACGEPAYKGNPQTGAATRIVSLNPCIDAIVAEVADPGQVLALSHYSRDPASSSITPDVAARFAITGGTVEEVLALDPDLVLAGGFLAPATRQAFADLGVELVTFGIASTPEESYIQLRQIARMLQQEDRGEALVARIEAALAEASAPDGTQQRSAVLWQQGQIVPGEATLVSELMRRVGFSSHSAALGLGQADYLPLEEMLADPPDVLFVAGDAPAQRHPVLRQLTGTRIASFETSLLYCGGPTMIRAAERLAQVRDGQA